MVEKEGWRGRFFGDFEVGDIFHHPLGRTITATDTIWFTVPTRNTAPVHLAVMVYLRGQAPAIPRPELEPEGPG